MNRTDMYSLETIRHINQFGHALMDSQCSEKLCKALSLGPDKLDRIIDSCLSSKYIKITSPYKPYHVEVTPKGKEFVSLMEKGVLS